MKHRHSFFVHGPDNPPNTFELVNGDSEEDAVLKVRHLQAAREWKATIEADDLDEHLRNELRKGRLTAQFVGKTANNVPEPLQRGFVEGFHLLWPRNPYLPIRDIVKIREVQNLPFVGSVLGNSTSKAIELPMNLSYLHINALPSPTLDALFENLWNFLRPTDPLLLAPLPTASVLEIDISSSQIQMRAIWASAPHPTGWHLDIPSVVGTRTEIGVFNEESGEDKDEFAIGGVTTILGSEKEFTPTWFTFPHRHHVGSSVGVTSELEPAYGSHPIIRSILPVSALRGPVDETLDHESCTLHGLYTLSKEVFVDKYQLAQLAQFNSGGIGNVRGVWGETDLEDPSYKTEGWGSVVLIDVATADTSSDDLTVELPVHLRYLEPSEKGGYAPITLLHPQIFWTCENSVEDFSISPFGPSSQSLLHTLFPHDAVFYHLPNHTISGDGELSLQVPVGNVSQVTFVQTLTVLGILTGFTYLFVRGVRLGLKGLRWRGKGKDKAKDI